MTRQHMKSVKKKNMRESGVRSLVRSIDPLIISLKSLLSISTFSRTWSLKTTWRTWTAEKGTLVAPKGKLYVATRTLYTQQNRVHVTLGCSGRFCWLLQYHGTAKSVIVRCKQVCRLIEHYKNTTSRKRRDLIINSKHEEISVECGGVRRSHCHWTLNQPAPVLLVENADWSMHASAVNTRVYNSYFFVPGSIKRSRCFAFRVCLRKNKNNNDGPIQMRSALRYK